MHAAAPLARPDRTADITLGTTRFLDSLGKSALFEFRLGNGRRVDICAIDRKGRLTFIEVKSCREDFQADAKWRDYLEFCDAFYFAVDKTFPLELLPADEGLILADSFGGAIVRPAREQTLAPARRKAVTLKFANQAARRATATILA